MYIRHEFNQGLQLLKYVICHMVSQNSYRREKVSVITGHHLYQHIWIRIREVSQTNPIQESELVSME